MDLYMILDVFVLICGIYALGQWVKLKQAGKLVDCKLIFPNGCNAGNCREPEAFYVYIMPRFFIFSVLTIATGLFAALNDVLAFLPSLATMIANGIFFLVIVYFGVVISKAYRRFFQ